MELKKNFKNYETPIIKNTKISLKKKNYKIGGIKKKKQNYIISKNSPDFKNRSI